VSLGRCIPELLAAGKVSPERAVHARRRFDDQRSELEKSMAPDAAEAAASERTLNILDYEALHKRQAWLRQVKALDFAEDWLTRGGERWGGGSRGGGPDGPDGPPPGEGPEGPANPRAARTLVALVEARRKAIEGEAFGKVREILERHRRNLIGKMRRPAEMDELGRAAFGEAVDTPAAKELAEAVAEAQELLRLRANAAGANIGKLENRGFAQHHDSRKVAEAGFDAWYAAERPRWDVERMIDEETGQPFTEASLEEVMREVFATIASDGASKRAAGAGGRMSFAARVGQHRFIHYKGFDAWKASQEQFGAGTAFDALLGELKGMSRAIAAMEILGPDPEAAIRYVRDRVAGDPSLFQPGQLRARDKAQGESAKVQRLWDEYTGALAQPESRRLALGFSTYRAIAAGAKLGSAAPKAISDIGFGMATRAFSGLPVVRVFGDYLKQLNPADNRDRLLAARLGFVYQTWTSAVSSQHRFLAEELTGEVAQRIADGVLRLSGLNWITDAGRAAQGLVTFVHVTQVRDQAWDALEPAWKAALQRYRIGPEQWDAIRSSPVSDDIGLLEPANIADVEARTRLLEMAHSEQDFAVPVPDLETRAWLHANARKGTLTGEVLRSSPFMFKTFTASVMIRHGGRMAEQQGIAGKAGYLFAVAVPVTVLGLFATQLLEIGSGRDPRPMDDPLLWADALANSGGLGILGDLVGITAEDRYMGWAEFAAGPLLGDVGQAADVGFDLAQGDDRSPWRAARLARLNTPGQNLWYLRLAADRLLADQVQTLLDPEYRRAWRAMDRRARDREQDYWWEPGASAPDRLPDFENALQGGNP
jgi:hypothetical protein